MPIWKKGATEKKDPDDVHKLQWDLNPWLKGLTLSSYSVIVESVTKDSDSSSSNVITAFISGGNSGCKGLVTLRAVRSDTVQKDFTIIIDIEKDYLRA